MLLLLLLLWLLFDLFVCLFVVVVVVVVLQGRVPEAYISGDIAALETAIFTPWCHGPFMTGGAVGRSW